MFVNIGMPSTSFNVYQPYIVEVIGDMGASCVLAARTLASLAVMLVVDRFYQLLDVRRGVGVSCFLTVAGFVVFSQASTLFVFLVGAVLAGCGYGLGGMVAMTLLTSRWYKSGIGEAVGIATVGSGVAAIVLPFICARLIEGVSLSCAFIIEAAIGAAVAVAVIALTRNRPSDMGLEPYDADAHAPARGTRRAKGAGKARIPVTEREVLPVAVRWAVYAAMAFVGAICTGGAVYLSVLMTSNGIDTMFAATMLSLLGVCLTVSKFIMGEMFDHIGTKNGSLLAFVIVGIGVASACLVGTGSPVFAAIAAICMGLGMPIGSVGLSVWSLELSDAKTGTKFIKNCNIGYAVGSFVMNTAPGFIKNLTGTYVTSYVIVFIGVVAAAIILVGAYARYRKGF